MIDEEFGGVEDEAFRRLVVGDAFNKLESEQAAWLRDEENLERWCAVLVELIQETDGKLADGRAVMLKKRAECWANGPGGRDEWFEYEAEYQQRRSRMANFKRHVQSRLTEAKRLRSELRASRQSSPQKSENIHFLRAAIYKHRERVLSGGYDPTAADRALWKALEGGWVEDEDIEDEDELEVVS